MAKNNTPEPGFSTIASAVDNDNTPPVIHFQEMDYAEEVKWEDGKKWQRRREKPKGNKEWGPWGKWYVVYTPAASFNCPWCGSPVVMDKTGRRKRKGFFIYDIWIYRCIDIFGCGWVKESEGTEYRHRRFVPCENKLEITFEDKGK